MQDNKNIANIEEQFTDSAWEKMQGILDKEMPVAPVRKRRWGWLWLLLFLGIMASGTYYNFVVKSTTQPNKIPNAAIANEIEKTNDNSEFEKKNDAVQYSKEKKAEKITNTSKSTIISDISPKEKITNSPKNISKTITEKNITKNNLYTIKENNFTNKKARTDDFSRREVQSNLTTKVVSTYILEAPVISEKESRIDDFPESSYGTGSRREVQSSLTAKVVNTEKIPTQNSPINTQGIATLSPQITKNNNAILQTSPDFDPIPKVRKFSHTYSIFTGVRTDEFRGYGSINEGLLAHYRFTPKVGLETGLMYANTRKNIRANIDYTNEYNELYPDNITRQNTDVSNVIKHNYLRLPLSITYRPRKKIQLAMGLNVGYRFDKIIKNLAEDQVVPMADDADTPTHESAIGINVNDPGSAGFTQIEVSYSFSVPKWDLAAHTGLRYYPIPRLGIDLNYQYGLINMTQGITPNRNSGLQLALVWQLHR